MAQGIKLDCYITSNGIRHQITTNHPLYKLRWVVITRCYNASPRDFPYYQGKGIRIFDEWINNQDSFFKWCLDNGWKRGLVLDRIDPTKDYFPDNCQFLTKTQNLIKMHKDNIMSGEKAPNAKLTADDVIEIRKRINLGITCMRIAADFNVAPSTIHAIKSGQNWKDK